MMIEEEFQITEETLDLFKEEIKNHTRPLDKISTELKLFEGVEASAETILEELSHGIDLRLQYLAALKQQWVDEHQNGKMSKEQFKKWDGEIERLTKILHSLNRYLWKDYEIMDIDKEYEEDYED